MQRYFFDVGYLDYSPDEVGEIHKDDGAAWKAATQIAGDLLKDIDGRFRPGHEWALEVTDEARQPIFSIKLHALKLKCGRLR
ncbi:DUF6894 family protein [Bradyrhizobium brasilense]|uniref:DUF6894 family protein n=1 Tax=Bradyrhizobium brasilense TaxID=1419277 RepID=UPI003B9694CF